MAGTWVRTGTVAVTNGSKKVTGNGTSWLSNLLQKVGKGCMCVIDNVISEVDYVNSDTELYLVEAWEGATASGKKYKIQVTVTDTIPELSSRISQSLAYANGQYGNLESWATGAAANVTLTSPAGNQVTVPNLSAMNSGASGPVEFDLRSPAQLLRWRHYGTGHTIFDASKSKSPADTDINNVNATIPWMATYPTLMGWNGATTYGVRVDSARVADAANAATDLRGGVIRTNGHDFIINDKRAMVGFGASEGNFLSINYAGDFDHVDIPSNLVVKNLFSSEPQSNEGSSVTRRDYVDLIRHANLNNKNHNDGDANWHYNEKWDGYNVANAPFPGPNWFHFREQQHSAGGWYKQEASHFHSDEEYFRRAINFTEQSWVRRWNSSNYNVSTGVFTPLLAVIGEGTMASDGNNGFWHRNGNTVTGHGLVFVPDHYDYNAPLRIDALPFVPNNSQFATVPLAIYSASVNVRAVFGSLHPNYNYIDIMCIDMDGSVRNMKASDIVNETNTHIRFSFTYYCA
jgi:hypothetical protein